MKYCTFAVLDDLVEELLSYKHFQCRSASMAFRQGQDTACNVPSMAREYRAENSYTEYTLGFHRSVVNPTDNPGITTI